MLGTVIVRCILSVCAKLEPVSSRIIHVCSLNSPDYMRVAKAQSEPVTHEACH